METLPGQLETAARWHPDRAMLIHGRQQWTYAEVNAWANRIAHALIACGSERGRPVALLLPSRPLFVAAYFGVMKAGGIAAPLNAMFTPTEVDAMVRYLDAPLLISTPELARSVFEAGSTGGARLLVWRDEPDDAVDDATDLAVAAANMPKHNLGLDLDPGAVATIFHTSGTTGQPKGAAQRHLNTVVGGRQMITHAGWRVAAEHIASPLPLFNNFGSTAILNMAVAAVATVTIIERWEAEEVFAAFRNGATRMVGTPTMYIYLLEAHDEGTHGPIALDPCIVGGQTIPVDVRVAFEERFSTRLLNLYGATETHAVTLTPLHGDYPAGSVGHPIGQSTVTVVDDAGDEVPPGTVGELVLGGDTVCAGYWLDAERTAESFGPRGWHSGDLGFADEEGFVHVVDRKKDLIITGGANIYPAEIEAVLYQHPDVVMACVIGLPDSIKGEIPKAFVVPRPSATSNASDLVSFVRERLAAYKCPRAIELVESLPTSAVGKVLKRELREQVLAGRASEWVGR